MLTDPYPYIANAEIYVQPSREEALSIAMLESQILCVPMVSTKTAGGLAMIKERENGLLADIDPESLAESIETMIKDDMLRKEIKERLSKIDYSVNEDHYKKQWSELLEG
jgi:glycosyltransferase involved in cell wall biosynthesis